MLLDTARNTYGQTTVAPYAVRAIPGAPVATPLAWEELEDPALHPRLHTLRTVPGRLDGGGDPWPATSPRPRPSYRAAEARVRARSRHAGGSVEDRDEGRDDAGVELRARARLELAAGD